MIKKEDCVFCQIVSGNAPSDKVYEDEDTLAFLNIKTVHPGGTLIIPKDHYENIYEVPDEILGKLGVTLKKVATATKEAMGADGVNVIMNNGKAAGQIIFHAHIHIIPRYSDDGLRHWPGKDYDKEKAPEIAKMIADHLE